MKVLVTPTSFGSEKTSRARELLEKYTQDISYNPYGRPLNEEEIIDLLQGVDGYIAGLDHITERVLENAPRSLKVISRYGVGVDRVDIAAAARQGIVVTNTPGTNSRSVAEMTFALMLCAARKIHLLDKKVKLGEWPRITGTELYNKTLGIVGLGAVGKGVALKARGFEMKILAFDPYIDRKFAEENLIEEATFAELIQRADFISLHIPLTRQTAKIINMDAIAKMKNGAILINTSRGGLVDEASVYDALKSGKLGGLGLDAFETEPPGTSPLFELDNVIVTPHAGAHTAEAVENMGVLAVQNLIEVLSGRECPNVIK